ncbi:TPA: hypothetical protein EYP66_17405 [Candidatus Poribacteria bacterium]|nr:hypothetical protein [Candidatus Poribacteria bacterium]
MHVGGAHVIGREGRYLSHDFEPTKGKTYSILFQYLAYSLNSIKDVNLESHEGSYRDIRGM